MPWVLSDLIVRTRDLHPREAARTLIAAIVDANHGHLQDDATGPTRLS